MNSQQVNLLEVIRDEIKEVSQYQIEYWQLYSDFTTWQFWILVLMLILPLIVLFIFIDQRKMLLLGFFGLNYHVWFAYINKFGVGLGLWEYPYHLIPSLPSFSLDASLVPVWLCCYINGHLIITRIFTYILYFYQQYLPSS